MDANDEDHLVLVGVLCCSHLPRLCGHIEIGRSLFFFFPVSFYYFLLFMFNLELQVKIFFFMFIPQVYWPPSDQDLHGGRGNICISSPDSRVPLTPRFPLEGGSSLCRWGTGVRCWGLASDHPALLSQPGTFDPNLELFLYLHIFWGRSHQKHGKKKTLTGRVFSYWYSVCVCVRLVYNMSKIVTLKE